MVEDGFEVHYRTDDAPWDIGRPQSAIVALEREGELSGTVLDIGCGTGDNALFVAGMGYEVWGVDTAPTAIKRARQKAAEAGLDAHFELVDALELGALERRFDTFVDSGLFHTLSDEARPVFKSSLEGVAKPGSTYFMLCFSELEPPGWGPRRVTKEEIRATFGDGWRVNYIRSSAFDSALERDDPVRAWLASLTLEA
ncbi:MAG: class I SAM-dependent methyltransferase [Terriglobia bacterium]